MMERKNFKRKKKSKNILLSIKKMLIKQDVLLDLVTTKNLDNHYISVKLAIKKQTIIVFWYAKFVQLFAMMDMSSNL